MADDSAGKPDWAIAFLGRLCLIGWLCAILFETFTYIQPLRQVFLLFGFWACVIALVHSLILLLIRRQGIFLIFVLISLPPTIHFALVIRNIVIQKEQSDPVESDSSQRIETDERATAPESAVSPETPAP